jgi:K+ transporter
MESPRIAPVIEAYRKIGLELERDDLSYLSAEPKIEVAPGSNRLLMLRRKIFIALSHLAHPLPEELGVKAEQRIGVGVSVPL